MFFSRIDFNGKTNFSTFEGNQCEYGSGTILLHSSNGKILFEYCNVLRNYQKSSDEGTFISYYPSVIVNKSCFFDDLGKGRLFYCLLGFVTIKDCKIDNCTTSGNDFQIEKIDAKVKFDYIPFFSTFQCVVKINVIFDKKINHSYSYMNDNILWIILFEQIFHA